MWLYIMHVLHLQIVFIKIIMPAIVFDVCTAFRLVALQVVFYLFAGIQWFNQGAI
jgi:hypothetical protein